MGARCLTHLDTAKLSAAAMLVAARREKLSDHEAAVITEVSGRFLDAGRAAPVTEAEWAVIEPVLTLLPRASRPILGRMH